MEEENISELPGIPDVVRGITVPEDRSFLPI
jgi:hypothetical protein